MRVARLRPNPRPTRVVSNPPVGGPMENPTVALLVSSLPADIEVVNFTWPLALWGRYDILHIHWPEFAVRHSNRALASVKRLLFQALLARLRRERVSSVWTVHNEQPHEPGNDAERRLLDDWATTATIRVYMNSAPRPEEPGPSTVIPRGDYSPAFAGLRDSWQGQQVPGRLVLFGFLRPYKGVEDLIDAMGDATEPSLTLRIVGAPHTQEYGAELAHRAANIGTVDVAAGYLDDSQLADEILRAEAVVLPYKKMYNSGAALLALTLGRPIIVPRTPTMTELEREMGTEWVFTYDGPLTAATLDNAARTFLSAERARLPPLSQRSWAAVGAAYAELYRSLRRIRE